MAPVVLAGRYRLEAPLGSGGMAEVWRAVDERLGRKVAVKLLHPRALPPERERFLLEVRALSRLFHPGIVQVLDLGEEVLFYTEGGPRRARYLLVGRVSPPEWLRLGLPREAVLHYPLEVDPLAFEWEGETLVLPGLRVYLGGPPEFVETPYYAWPLTGPRGGE